MAEISAKHQLDACRHESCMIVAGMRRVPCSEGIYNDIAGLCGICRCPYDGYHHQLSSMPSGHLRAGGFARQRQPDPCCDWRRAWAALTMSTGGNIQAAPGGRDVAISSSWAKWLPSRRPPTSNEPARVVMRAGSFLYLRNIVGSAAGRFSARGSRRETWGPLGHDDACT